MLYEVITAFDNSDDYYIGMLGMHGTKTSSLVINNCDLMIVVGSRFSDRVTCNINTFAKTTKVLHFEIDPAEVNKNVGVDHCVVGDLNYVLKALNDVLPKQSHQEWLSQIFDWKKEYPLIQYSLNEDDVLPQYVLNVITSYSIHYTKLYD